MSFWSSAAARTEQPTKSPAVNGYFTGFGPVTAIMAALAARKGSTGIGKVTWEQIADAFPLSAIQNCLISSGDTVRIKPNDVLDMFVMAAERLQRNPTDFRPTCRAVVDLFLKKAEGLVRIDEYPLEQMNRFRDSYPLEPKEKIDDGYPPTMRLIPTYTDWANSVDLGKVKKNKGLGL